MSEKMPIYMDYNATTPIDRRVADAMLPYLYDHFGNPSSAHIYGRQTREAIEQARSQVAALLRCQPKEVLFTSGGTESNNTVLLGIARAQSQKGRHLITSVIEHPAILEPCRSLEAQGFRVTYVGVDMYGRVDPAEVQAAICEETTLISIMHANNEIGTLQPIEEIAHIAHAHGILMHTDAAQSVGKVPVWVDALGVDLLSVAGHKLYAPKGVGALYVRESVPFERFLHGANHESGRRAGTENVLEIVGLGAAASIAAESLATESARIQSWRDLLWTRLHEKLGERIRRNGDAKHGLPNTLHIGLRDIFAGDLLQAIQNEVACSAGSACHAGSARTMSAVIRAIGVPDAYAWGSLRLSLGRMTTTSEIERVAEILIEALA